MRRYDEPIEVRRGLVAGQEAPEQFIWRDRLWVVRDVVSHWVETGAWWDQEGIAALLGVGAGTEPPESTGSSGQARPTGRSGGTASTGVSAVPLGADLLAESDIWRVEASRGRFPRWPLRQARPAKDEDVDRGYGVFDLAFDWTLAGWRLIGCAD